MEKSLGILDKQGREIYEDEDGELYVYLDGERNYDPNLEDLVKEVAE